MTNDHEAILAKFKELRSYQEVADKFDMSRQRVHQIVTGYTSPSNKSLGRWKRGAWLEGAPINWSIGVAAIAKERGVSTMTVYKHAKK